MLAQLGDLSSARQALEGAELAPGNQETLEVLRSRLAQFRDPVARQHRAPRTSFRIRVGRGTVWAQFDDSPQRSGEWSIGHDQRTSQTSHVESPSIALVFPTGRYSWSPPECRIEAVRMGRITALRKPAGGVRGIVVGDVIRRLVARTVAQQVGSNVEKAQQVGSHVEKATAPYQYALTTRAGCECVPHVVQALCEANPNTIVSVDGVSAYDTISREAMMQGLLDMEGGETVLRFCAPIPRTACRSICGGDDARGHPHHSPGRGW